MIMLKNKFTSPSVLRRLPESLHALGRDPAIYVLIKHFFPLLLPENMLKYPHVYQKINANRPMAEDIAENRTSRASLPTKTSLPR